MKHKRVYFFSAMVVLAAAFTVSCSVKKYDGSAKPTINPSTATAYKTFLYVTNSGSDSISVFSFEELDSEPKLTLVETFDIGTSGAAPNPVIANRDSSYLYVGYGTGIKTFSIAKTGNLTAASSANTALSAAVNSLAFSHDESLLFTGGGALINVFGVDINGELIRVEDTPAGTPCSTVLHPKLDIVYQVEKSDQSLIRRFIYSIEGDITNSFSDSSGADTPHFFAINPKATVAVAVHDGIVPIVFGMDSSIQSFTVNATDGSLTAVSKINSDNNARSRPHHVIMHPTLDVFYVANHGSDNLAAYTINSTTAVFSQLGSAIETGEDPEFSAIDPTGKHLVVVNSSGNSISVFKLDPTTGAPTAAATATVAVGSTPRAATFVRVPQ